MNAIAKTETKLPTVTRHADWFKPTWRYREDDQGNVESWEVFEINIDENSALLPEDTCRAIIEEVDAASVRASRAEAKTIAAVLIGSYPDRKLFDPKIYTRAIVSVIERFPADIGWQAIEKIVLDLVFTPAPADVNKACERLIAQRRHVKRTAEAILKEHARRQAAVRTPAGHMTPDELDEKIKQACREKGIAYRPGMALSDVLFGPAAGREKTKPAKPANRIDKPLPVQGGPGSKAAEKAMREAKDRAPGGDAAAPAAAPDTPSAETPK